jgi:hypothetical protein
MPSAWVVLHTTWEDHTGPTMKTETLMRSSSQHQPTTQNANEGEGSRTAAHRYEAGVKRTVQSGHILESASKAARALDGPEGAELRRAEVIAKRHKSPAGQQDKTKKRS